MKDINENLSLFVDGELEISKTQETIKDIAENSETKDLLGRMYYVKSVLNQEHDKIELPSKYKELLVKRRNTTT